MICKHCGTEINTKNREADGSVICPGCGTVYRPKSEPKPEQQPVAAPTAAEQRPPRTENTHRNSSQPRRAAKRSGAGLKAAIAIFAAVLVIGGVVALVTHSKNNKNSTVQSSSNPTSVSEPNQVLATAQPVSYEHQILGLVYTEQAKPREEFMVDLCQQLGMNFYDYESYQMNFVMDNPAGIYDAACELIDAGCTTIIIYDKSDTTYPFDAADLLAQTRPDIKVVLTRNPNYVPNATPLPTQVPMVQPVIESQYKIQNALSNFDGDRAWVRYLDDDYNQFYALIDTNGYVVYSIPAYELKGWGGGVEAMTFPDGVCCLWQGSSGSSRSSAGMLIIDSAGNTIFNGIDAQSDYRYFYMGYGDGTILALENESGFSENSYSICEIDLTGAIVHQTKLSSEIVNSLKHPTSNGLTLFDDFTYFGQDMFYGSWTLYNLTNVSRYAVYDREKHQLVSLNGVCLFLPFENDISVGGKAWEENMDRYRKVYQITINDIRNAETSGGYVLNNDELALLGNYHVYPYQASEGLIVTDYRNDFFGFGEEIIGVYDFYGNLIAAFPDNWDVDSVSGFHGGYAKITLTGADGKKYVTVIDTAGQLQFEPMKADDSESAVDKYFSVQINGQTALYDLTTNSVEYTDLQGNRIKNGFNVFRVYYGSVSFTRNDGSVLDTVYILKPGTYNASAPAPQPTAAPTTQTAAQQKNYSSPSDFSIEGKWKNTGTYTYGQVQSGAIVSFDGTTCNVVSPADTYAFYKDGNDYRLDCTTMLFSETQSFVVKIVDQDHIDIYVGRDYLELSRVS